MRTSQQQNQMNYAGKDIDIDIREAEADWNRRPTYQKVLKIIGIGLLFSYVMAVMLLIVDWVFGDLPVGFSRHDLITIPAMNFLLYLIYVSLMFLYSRLLLRGTNPKVVEGLQQGTLFFIIFLMIDLRTVFIEKGSFEITPMLFLSPLIIGILSGLFMPAIQRKFGPKEKNGKRVAREATGENGV